MMDDQDVSLISLVKQTLIQSAQLLDQSPINQSQLSALLSRFHLIDAMVQSLAIISPNELLSDLANNVLFCLLIPYWHALSILQLHSSGSVERKAHLQQARQHLDNFMSSVKQHQLLDSLPTVDTLRMDPAQKRTNKIAMYRQEKDLKDQLAAIQDNVISQDEERERAVLLLQFRLYYIKAANELQSVDMEYELLQASIPMSDLPRKETDDTTWRVDQHPQGLSSWFDPAAGPVLDPGGRILRPFTITSAADPFSTRLTIKDQVFGPSHRLPTMTIDDFLDQEFAAGRVLQGGEADAQRQDQESAARKQLVEMDNLEAYEEGERRLTDERRWDDYRDTHKRGDGNRIGRG